MSQSPQHNDSLHALLEALANETITVEQHRDLQNQLKSDPIAREAYIEFIDLHFALGQVIAAAEPVELHSQPTSYSSRFPISTIALAAAAILLSITTLLLALYPPRWNSIASEDPPSKLSQVYLQQTAQAEFFGDLIPPLDSQLYLQSEYALTKGLVELRFPKGATAIIEAPAIFSVVSDEKLKLLTGQCSVHAPEGAQGFQLETPLTEVVDLGTRFSVSVSESGGTDVQVVEGIAEVTPKSDSSQTVRLTDQQSLSYVEQGLVRTRTKSFDANRYRQNLPDRIISYDLSTPNTQTSPAENANAITAAAASELSVVHVQRGGIPYAYKTEELIGIELLHYQSDRGKEVAAIAYRPSDSFSPLAATTPSTTDSLITQIVSDRYLNTGVINPGGSRQPLTTDPRLPNRESNSSSDNHEGTPGLGFRFKKGLINDVGPDFVLFDLQTVTNPIEGDAFHLSPLKFGIGLHSITIEEFDITMRSSGAESLEPFALLRYSNAIGSLEALRSEAAFPSRVHLNFRALAVGIDLSDLGYPIGAEVHELFLQDAADDSDSIVDPVFIGGFPPLPPSPQLRHGAQP